MKKTLDRPISFKTTKKEFALIEKCADRAAVLARDPSIVTTIEMDLSACNANGCKLDLEKLLGFNDANFGHDVFGINRHLNRETGKLMDCFLPRCAKR